MTTSPSTPESVRTNNASNNYTFYDENYKPMWNRGISRKIGESAFVQQKLPTYRLKWSPYTVCPCLLLMGAFFTGMGIGIKYFSDNIQEVIIPYTDCKSEEYPAKKCSDVINPSGKSLLEMDGDEIENCTCHVHFELKEPLNGTVYMYYTLTDYFQNHRLYYLSRDENQLKGKLFNKHGEPRKASSACEPFDKDAIERIIHPCGLMANSMFSDAIDLLYAPEDNENGAIQKYKHVPLRRTGIAWQSDRMDKYENPEEFSNPEDPKWDHFTKPRAWKKTLWELDAKNASNNGVTNEDFIVWMRTAAFPWFRKLYRIVDSSLYPFEKGLPKGKYSLRIEYNYDVKSFKGEKTIILTTTNIVAGKNMFLAIVYMGTGVLCIFLSIVLFIAYKCALKSVTKSLKEE